VRSLVVVLGAGFVGLVTARSLVQRGHQVLLVDRDRETVERFGNGLLPVLLASHAERWLEPANWRKAEHGQITPCWAAVEASDKPDADRPDAGGIRLVRAWLEEGADLVVCLPAPAPTLDPSIIRSAIQWWAAAGGRGWVIVRSTLWPTALAELNQDLDDSACTLAHWPEFFAEGVGERQVESWRVGLANPAMRSNRRLSAICGEDSVGYTFGASSLGKIGTNLWLGTRLAWVNQIAGLARLFDAPGEDALAFAAQDRRVGDHWLTPGAWGGSCLPKEAQAVQFLASEYADGVVVNLGLEVARYAPVDWTVHEIREAVRGLRSPGKKPVVMLAGMAFKSGTSDRRHAWGHEILDMIDQDEDNADDWNGVEIRIHDREMGALVTPYDWVAGRSTGPSPLAGAPKVDVLVCLQAGAYPTKSEIAASGVRVLIDGRGLATKAGVPDGCLLVSIYGVPS